MVPTSQSGASPRVVLRAFRELLVLRAGLRGPTRLQPAGRPDQQSP